MYSALQLPLPVFPATICLYLLFNFFFIVFICNLIGLLAINFENKKFICLFLAVQWTKTSVFAKSPPLLFC